MPAARSLDDLKAIARTVRKEIITSTTAAGSGHPTSSLSGVEVAVQLYFGGFLRYDPKKPFWPQRDRFILSKGHAAPLLYAVLAEAGYFSRDLLPTLRKLGSPLEGHPNYAKAKAEGIGGIEASTGSLGQGLSLGLGHALAVKLDGFDSRVFVMMGDGEQAEGQVWEAVSSAPKFQVDNLIAVVDQNGYQQTGATKDVLDLRPLSTKYESFGWFVQECEGNDMAAVGAALQKAVVNKGRPSAIISKTKKGFPIQDLIGDPNHHGKPLTQEQADKALAFIDAH
ncbi:MAG: transketolase [Gemmataceae bacterium]